MAVESSPFLNPTGTSAPVKKSRAASGLLARPSRRPPIGSQPAGSLSLVPWVQSSRMPSESSVGPRCRAATLDPAVLVRKIGPDHGSVPFSFTNRVSKSASRRRPRSAGSGSRPCGASARALVAVHLVGRLVILAPADCVAFSSAFPTSSWTHWTTRGTPPSWPSPVSSRGPGVEQVAEVPLEGSHLVPPCPSGCSSPPLSGKSSSICNMASRPLRSSIRAGPICCERGRDRRVFPEGVQHLVESTEAVPAISSLINHVVGQVGGCWADRLLLLGAEGIEDLAPRPGDGGGRGRWSGVFPRSSSSGRGRCRGAADVVRPAAPAGEHAGQRAGRGWPQRGAPADLLGDVVIRTACLLRLVPVLVLVWGR